MTKKGFSTGFRGSSDRRYDRNDEEADPFNLGEADSRFENCEEPLFYEQELPRGIVFDRVMVVHEEDVVEHGEVTIGYFPNGFVERAIIWLKHERSEGVMTLTIDPLSGSVRIIAGDMDVPDDFWEVEEDG